MLDRKTALIFLRQCLAAGAILAQCLTPLVTSRAEAAGPDAARAARPPYSPALREPVANNLYWGDLHLHTRLSMDAYINGTHNIGQEEAYRFAMGETVVADNGEPARLRRPLDFLAVTDHSENMGIYTRIAAGDPDVLGTPAGKRYAQVRELAAEVGMRRAFLAVMREHGPMPNLPPELQRSMWQEVARVADEFDQPGRFSTLIGYEWTSMIGGDNLHRVVLFRDRAERVSRVLPSSAQDDSDPESLWAALARYEEEGGQVLAIAHNGNLSNGRMFAPNRVGGTPLDLAYAEQRSRWEPLYEVTQVKGDGETHPALSPTDEFADFETWDKTNVANSAPKEPWMLPYEYARSGLREGLRHQQALGANPFRFGMIGSSDIHTGLATTVEDNFFGKFVGSEPAPDRYLVSMGGQSERNWELGAAGLAAVWAPENSREAIFDALRRREVYATTGSRIRLRFFAGWDFSAEDIHRADYVRTGYRRGVPMGGLLPRREGAGAPVFLIHAARDPDAANLDRAQVVKGWVGADGTTHEKLYDVALADGRKVRDQGRVQAVGSTVTVATASYSNAIGDPELATWWRDPDFNPSRPAFYYVRVLEIPTPRWTTYDAAFFSTDLPAEIPRTVQERAYSSPIWYQP